MAMDTSNKANVTDNDDANVDKQQQLPAWPSSSAVAIFAVASTTGMAKVDGRDQASVASNESGLASP